MHNMRLVSSQETAWALGACCGAAAWYCCLCFGLGGQSLVLPRTAASVSPHSPAAALNLPLKPQPITSEGACCGAAAWCCCLC